MAQSRWHTSFKGPPTRLFFAEGIASCVENCRGTTSYAFDTACRTPLRLEAETAWSLGPEDEGLQAHDHEHGPVLARPILHLDRCLCYCTSNHYLTMQMNNYIIKLKCTLSNLNNVIYAYALQSMRM